MTNNRSQNQDAKSVLIIDDEPDIRELLEITLGRMGIDTVTAENVGQGKQVLDSQTFNLCLTDMRLPDGDGLEIVDYIQEKYSNLPVAMISAHGTMDSAITALKKGAFDFVSKPVDLKQLRDLVSTALKLSEKQNQRQPKEIGGNLMGESEAIMELKAKAVKLSRSQAPVFINGESGSGKELVARLIHEQGPRAEQPFIAVNCGAIPSELMESEFFGHKKGSFTGAVSDKEGFFQAAQGGTLFLDEVADLPLNMQVKLLRAIQEKSVRPIGEQKEIPVDIRVLSASHKDLNAEVDQKLFRQDLYYRINVIQLDVPPLRERTEDIPGLADVFLARLSESYELPPAHLSKDALRALSSYSFPGNVRELENILERAFTLSDKDEIQVEDLGLKVPAGEVDSGVAFEKPADYVQGTSLEDYLESIERDAITKALEETRWNKTAAAKKLGITFRALRYRLKKLNLE